ncbi:hypothetical protein JQC92_05360 [Shewanella sp. 202IG2-18]|uniref:hypothetical protein n=1 Tax=Parashewanella hymeniacidonis TaxID=2807618 RepID=UPI001960A2D4|nr:hypothetical protein [Parashewanella hymeniacidonis]MBM7071465.1 hypothetical protein [Parashewanella hymeniacidonis]
MSGIALSVPFQRLSSCQVELVREHNSIELSNSSSSKSNVRIFVKKILDYLSSFTSGFHRERLSNSLNEMNDGSDDISCRKAMFSINQELKYAQGVYVSYRCTKPDANGQCQVSYYLNSPHQDPIFLRSVPASEDSEYVQNQLYRQRIQELMKIFNISVDDHELIDELLELIDGEFEYSDDLLNATQQFVEHLNQAGQTCSFEAKRNGVPPLYSVSLSTMDFDNIVTRSIPDKLKLQIVDSDDSNIPVVIEGGDEGEPSVDTIKGKNPTAAEGDEDNSISNSNSSRPVKMETCRYSELMKTMSKQLGENWDYLIFENQDFYEPFNEITGPSNQQLSESDCDELAKQIQKNGWNQGVRCKKVNHADGVSYYLSLASEVGKQTEEKHKEFLLVSFPTAILNRKFAHKLV